MSGGTTKGWFLQLRGERRGPFPAWQISRYLLLQRLDGHSLVSRDGESWEPLAKLPELHPQRRIAILELPEEERQRLEATERWVADHPALFRQAHGQPGGEEGYEEQGYSHLESRPQQAPNRLLAYAVVVLVLLAVAAIPYLIPVEPKLAEPRCDSPIVPGVNWSNCLMSNSSLPGADLSSAIMRNINLSSSVLTGAKLTHADLAYANLSLSDLAGAQLQNAQLKGANLRNANLRGANLEGADLSYADLSGAQLKGAKLSNARLGNAIWEENIRCMPESLGSCIPATRPQ